MCYCFFGYILFAFLPHDVKAQSKFGSLHWFFYYCPKSNNSFFCLVTPEIVIDSCIQMLCTVIVNLVFRFVLSRSINSILVFEFMFFLKNDSLFW